MKARLPDNSPEPMPFGAGRSAGAVPAASRHGLSLLRLGIMHARHYKLVVLILAVQCALITSCSKSEVTREASSQAASLTASDFVDHLKKGGLTILQDSPIDCPFFKGCKKRHAIYLKSLDEWIEVYEFDTAQNAKAAFPNGTYADKANGIDCKVALKQNLALMVWDQHSQWKEIWQIWQTF
jgi:hypothetical protein